MNKWRHSSPYLLFRYLHLHSTSGITNWPTWSLNAARWSKKFHDHASTYWRKKSFPSKTRNPENSRNSITCFAEPLLKSTVLKSIVSLLLTVISESVRIPSCTGLTVPESKAKKFQILFFKHGLIPYCWLLSFNTMFEVWDSLCNLRLVEPLIVGGPTSTIIYIQRNIISI